MNRYEIENKLLQTKNKKSARDFFLGQVKILQGRQKVQVTCPAAQVVSKVSVEPCQSSFAGSKKDCLQFEVIYKPF